jgi:VWA domain-containing protein
MMSTPLDMNELPTPSSSTTAGIGGGDVSEGAEGRRPIVRAGRLAGRAIVLAWVISVGYHAVLFVVMYLLPWLVGLTGNVSGVQAPVTDLVSPLAETSITVSPFKSDVATPTKASASQERMEFKPERLTPMDSLRMERPKELEILGIGSGGSEIPGEGFSIPMGGGGPTFFGLGGQARGARRIVYVVDRSGSMMSTMHGVIRELKESIGRLRRTQKFHVIFFNSGQPLENPPRRLVTAVRSHKREAFEFFDGIVPMGSTDPRAAMRRAFAVEPDLIYFLTDGLFDEHAASLLKQLDRWNHNRSVRLFTIAYVDQQGATVLERLAREHNGEYRFVSENEIFGD